MKRAAICIGGHFRTPSLYNNIKENILDVLNSNGIETDVFISMWDTEGHRDNNFGGAISIDKIVSLYKPTVIEVEKSDREFFLKTYKSDNVNKKYSSPETSGDSASMWYKLWRSKELVVSHSIHKDVVYDLVFRVRSDIEMTTPLDISDVRDCLRSDTVYMPISHGLYLDVTKGMMDHYFFGPTNLMDQIFDLYIDISDYLDLSIPHTAEGFLWYRIESLKIPIKRFKTSYNVYRPYKMEKVCDSIEN
ncbi:MAG: hypothetical protein PHG66_06730 [Candidatus Colwellbacteria bacterium]|nr:hypothetical protein [Candidatus Colwellbacteria bacterium]